MINQKNTGTWGVCKTETHLCGCWSVGGTINSDNLKSVASSCLSVQGSLQCDHTLNRNEASSFSLDFQTLSNLGLPWNCWAGGGRWGGWGWGRNYHSTINNLPNNLLKKQAWSFHLKILLNIGLRIRHINPQIKIQNCESQSDTKCWIFVANNSNVTDYIILYIYLYLLLFSSFLLLLQKIFSFLTF